MSDRVPRTTVHSAAQAAAALRRYRKVAVICISASLLGLAILGGPAMSAVVAGDDEFSVQHVEGGQVENAFVDDKNRNEGYLTVRYQVGPTVYRLTDRVTEALHSCSAREAFIRTHYPCSRWPTVRYSPGHPENSTLVEAVNRSWAPIMLIVVAVIFVPIFLLGLYFGFGWMLALSSPDSYIGRAGFAWKSDPVAEARGAAAAAGRMAAMETHAE
jgi:hypothetical protein